MRDSVLDASAVIALLDSEPGADVVQAALPSALLSSVNLAEVYSTFADRGPSAAAALQRLRFAIHEIVPFTEEMAELAGKLRPITQTLGLSLGDRACLAFAILRDADVLTADKSWTKLSLPCRIHAIR